MPVVSFAEWDRLLTQYPHSHLLQTTSWARLKEAYGWEAVPVCAGDGGALVLFRKLPLGLRVAYIPKGPLGERWTPLWDELDRVCKLRRTIFLKVEPDVFEPGEVESARFGQGFIRSEAVQPRRTILISLEGQPADWLAAMKQKWRYNIRLAKKKGVEVSQSDDVRLFHRLMLQTGGRDGFGVHSLDYYQRAFDLFASEDACVLLLATYYSQPLAALMAFRRGNRAWYFYGASSEMERQRMPNHLLQWEAMNWARRHGCRIYDLWGVPDFNEEKLETRCLERSGGLWSVYRFKRGFGGQLARTIGAWDRVYQPALYALYRLLLRFRAGGMG